MKKKQQGKKGRISQRYKRKANRSGSLAARRRNVLNEERKGSRTSQPNERTSWRHPIRLDGKGMGTEDNEY
jgi:hypothetical protein